MSAPVKGGCALEFIGSYLFSSRGSLLNSVWLRYGRGPRGRLEGTLLASCEGRWGSGGFWLRTSGGGRLGRSVFATV